MEKPCIINLETCDPDCYRRMQTALAEGMNYPKHICPEISTIISGVEVNQIWYNGGDRKERLQMQAYSAYYDGGKFIPTEPVKIPKGSKVVVTVIDFPVEKVSKIEDNVKNNLEWLDDLEEAVRLSMDEELPYIPRLKSVREPLDFDFEE